MQAETAADHQHLFGPGGSHIQQPVRFGRALRLILLLAQLINGRFVLLQILQVQQHPHLSIQARAAPGRRLVRSIPNDYHRELQPFSRMDAHNLHRPFGRGPRLSFPAAAIPQVSHILQERTYTDQAAIVGIGQQLGHIPRSPVQARLPQCRPVTALIQKRLEDIGHTAPSRLAVQLPHQVDRPLPAPPIILTRRNLPLQRLPQRLPCSPCTD